MEEQIAFFVCTFSLPSAPNNPYFIAAQFGMAKSDPLHYPKLIKRSDRNQGSTS